MTKKTTSSVRQIMKDSLRMYFAPLRGAYRGIKSEIHQVDRDIELRRKARQEPSDERTRSA